MSRISSVSKLAALLILVASPYACTSLKTGLGEEDVSAGEGGRGATTGAGGGILSGEGGASGDADEVRSACGECTLWLSDSCGEELGCRATNDGSGSCTCGAVGRGERNEVCSSDRDCAAGHTCWDKLCRPWCALTPQADLRGGCDAGESCVRLRSIQEPGAGLCLRCGECDPILLDACGEDRSCSEREGCTYCRGVGQGAVGTACSWDADCAGGLACASGVCRSQCVPTAGATPSCEPSLECVPLQNGSYGVCTPCGECGLFGEPRCRQGFSCYPYPDACPVCLPTGTQALGAPCRDHSACQEGLFCVGERCEPYCSPELEPSGCGPGTYCVAVTGEPGLGVCLACGECEESTDCGAGLTCRTYNQCTACLGSGGKPDGAPCDNADDCSSNLCLEGVCKRDCSSSECDTGERCVPAPTQRNAMLRVCEPCEECDILSQSGCDPGWACVGVARDCAVCYPAGSRAAGEICTQQRDCRASLVCANGVCRNYCSPRDAATCPGTCATASARLTPTVGICLACGECELWSDDSCGSPQLTCNDVQTCTVCERNVGSAAEGQPCSAHVDCVSGLHCHAGSCRAYCQLGASAGEPGTCADNRTCRSGGSDLRSVGAGVCLP